MDLYLYNTLYILKKSVNLIFILKLQVKGAKMGFNDDDITITIKGIKFKAFLFYGLYAFDIWQLEPPLGLTAYIVTTIWHKIWYKRIGYLGEQNLQRLKTMLTGIDLSLDNCVYILCV